MNAKKLLILAGVFAALVVLVLLTRSEPSHGVDTEGAWVEIDLSRVEEVEVASPDGDPVRVSRSGDVWVMPSKADYPVAFARFRDFMTSLTELEAGPPILGGEDMLEELGLDEAGATVVTWKTAEGEPLGSLKLGAPREGAVEGQFGRTPGGRYARTGDGPVVLVDASPRGLPMDAMDWLEARLFAFAPSDIARITVTTGEDAPFTLDVEGYSDITLRGLDAETEALDTDKAGRLVRAFQYLNFTDVRPGDTPFEPASTLVLRLDNGIEASVEIGGTDSGDTLLRYSVAWNAPEAAPAEGEAPQPPPAPPEPLEELRRKSAWTYTIAPHAATPLRFTRAGLVKPVEPETEADENGEPGG
jgi:hypothetical protein